MRPAHAPLTCQGNQDSLRLVLSRFPERIPKKTGLYCCSYYYSDVIFFLLLFALGPSIVSIEYE